MKITILKNKKKMYVRGDLEGLPVKEYLDKFFSTEDFDEYQIEAEIVKNQYPKPRNIQIMSQSGD